MSKASCLAKLEEKIEYYKKLYYFLSADHHLGNIPAGGEHIDAGVRLVGLEEYRSHLWTDNDSKAHLESSDVMKRYIEKWNKQREWQVHRSTDFIDSFLLPYDKELSS